MGTKITSIGTRAPWNTRILPAVTRSLEGWFELDTEARRGAFNRAMSKPNGDLIGSPGEFPTHLRMGPTAHILTKIQESVEMTIFVLSKTVIELPADTATANGAMYVGSYIGAVNTALAPPGITAANSFGVSISSINNARASFANTRSDGSGGVNASSFTVTGTPQHQWAIRSLRVKLAAATASDHTANLVVEQTNANPRVPSLAKLRIGGNTSPSTFMAPVDVSQCIIYSAALSNAEMDAVVDGMRKRAARLGIAA